MARKFAVSLSELPAANTERSVTFRNLSGGLNLWELDYRMEPDQSPEMKNLWWRDGLLGCRDGQEYVWQQPLGKGLCCYERLFHGYVVAHIGDGLFAGRPGVDPAPVKLWSGLPEVRGSFAVYGERLLYKTAGAFVQLLWDEGLTAEPVPVYTPVTVINCAPDGAGDLYQPENRLCPLKTVWYNAASETRGVSFTAGYNDKSFTFESDEPVTAVTAVYVNETPTETYTLSEDRKTVYLASAPGNGVTVQVLYTVGVRTYALPVKEADAVTEVTVDGQPAEFTFDPEAGTVTLTAAPPVQEPPVNNTLRITYEKANPDAEASILDCRYAAVFGGTGSAVLILAGSQAQPNACFWNGSHTAMDPGYFPMEQYNLFGDGAEAVTGFGRQAGYLVVFKEHSLGRCQLGSEELDGRALLTLNYTPIQHAVGCDLPWTIRTVENNLVWCSTSGVWLLKDTTAAMENTVTCISRNVAGCESRPGLLAELKNPEQVCALEDGERYWVCTGDHAYVWDHVLSDYGKPSWFFFTNIPAVSFVRADARQVCHLDGQGRVSRFVRSFRDYGGPIEKVYTFAAQSFGSYERLKNIRKVILTTRSDTDSVLHIRYETDHERRWDKTPIRGYSYRLSPRKLEYRFLGVRRYALVSVRRPGCRRVRHFTVRLENREAGCDMAVVAAQMFYTMEGKER